MNEQGQPVVCMSIRCNFRELSPTENYFECPGQVCPKGQTEPVKCPVTLCEKCGEKQAEGPDGHKCGICRIYWFAPILHKRN